MSQCTWAEQSETCSSQIGPLPSWFCDTTVKPIRALYHVYAACVRMFILSPWLVGFGGTSSSTVEDIAWHLRETRTYFSCLSLRQISTVTHAEQTLCLQLAFICVPGSKLTFTSLGKRNLIFKATHIFPAPKIESRPLCFKYKINSMGCKFSAFFLNIWCAFSQSAVPNLILMMCTLLLLPRFSYPLSVTWAFPQEMLLPVASFMYAPHHCPVLFFLHYQCQ